MSSSSRRVRHAVALALGAVLTVGTTGASATVSSDAPTYPVTDPQQQGVDPTLATGPGVYLVTLRDLPVAAYTGGIDGFPATRPRAGRRLDRTDPGVVAYAQRLRDRQDRVLRRVGDPEVLYRFTTALDGFAARLSGAQVKALRALDDVVLVERSTKQRIDAVRSPDFLGLTGPRGLWAQEGGPDDAGTGVVVGVVDTGIWPENPSFAGVPLRRPGVSKHLPRFHGACAVADQWGPQDCNDKVVSARYFVKGFGAANTARSEYLSPRDGTGHGSHTASTAAGNHGVAVRVEGQDLGRASGMAPAARIAVYKACWAAPNPDDDGCTTADTVAAIDRAVADGVDVLNYSISGSRATEDTVERAFLNAATAGVFVATSAGNGGPQGGTVAHPSPWVTTVGASTHQVLQGAVRLGDGSSYVGAMVSDDAVAATGIVLGSDVALPGADREDARRCRIGSLDAERVQDKIVVCDRGVVARVDKSTAVARAGGAGMVLVNTEPASTDADFHAVPTVHLDVTAGDAVEDYVHAAGGNATASLDPDGSEPTAVPQIADFSARGPALAGAGDLLKPDLTAPGVSVLAAVAPPSDSGRLWDLYSGTSMSAPHVAGLAAVIRAAEPTWSPARVKSAMMTTGYDLQGTAGPFAEGAGHVDPKRFLDPGLVYDATPRSWRGYLAGTRPATAVNLPSVAVGSLVGQTVVTRRVTNVSSTTESYHARVSGLDGVDVTVRPASLTLAPGQSKRFRLRFATGTKAPVDRYAKGWLTWTGLTHQVRIPLVARPVAVSAPAELAGSGASGSLVVRGTSGSTQQVPLTSTGLVPASPTGISLVPGGFDPAAPEADADTFATTIDVPAGTDVARVEMDSHNAADDVDVYVYREGELVASSAGGSPDETATILAPPAGRYTVYVNAHTAANGATTTGQLYTWVVPATGGTPVTLGSDRVDAAPGRPFHYSVDWSDLDLAARWFGAVRYGESGDRTLLSVS